MYYAFALRTGSPHRLLCITYYVLCIMYYALGRGSPHRMLCIMYYVLCMMRHTLRISDKPIVVGTVMYMHSAPVFRASAASR